MTLRLGTKVIAGVYNAHHLLEFKWSDCLINDIAWLRADTFSWQNGNIYVSVYNHLVADVQGITSETETIGSYTVTFYRATDGHKVVLADQEQTVLNIYNETGIAWYYVLDTVNTQFKLPRTKYGFEGLRNYVGDLINESLPSHTHTRGTMNITGSIEFDVWADSATGAFYDDGGDKRSGTGNDNNSTGGKKSFDASRSWTGSTSNPDNSTYQDNAPVQERATQMYLYFYVGDYTQSAIEQTAGLNAELFNGKVDRDGSNMVASVKNFDGQWVGVGLVALSSATAIGTYTIDLSAHLPNDGYNYLIEIGGYIYPSSGTAWTDVYSGTTQARISTANQYIYSNQTAMIPVYNNRQITYEISGSTLSQNALYLMAYRRLGTNQ